jgi:hypothetical protein
MREVKLLTWCDMCWDDGMIQTAAEHSFTIGIVSGESRPALKLLELCETHSKTIVELQELLVGVGQLPELDKKRGPGRPPVSEPVREHPTKSCPVCKRQIKNNILVAHIWQEHRSDEKPAIPKICPECREQIDTGQGMTQHRKAAHGYDAVADALSGVKGYKA